MSNSNRPPASVIAFPQNRRIGKIRRVASNLTRKSGRGASAYWQKTVSDLERQLRRANLSENAIRQEIGRFEMAVRAEFERIIHAERPEGQFPNQSGSPFDAA